MEDKIGDIMLGNIIGIEDNVILLKLNVELDKIQNLINMYVVFEEDKYLTVGEIVDIKELLENAFKLYYNMQITKNKAS